MRIPQDIIDRVVQEINIVELISESVPLRKAGTSYKGLCPFHGEKTPSFVVTPDKGIFHCFGCGEGGSALQFLMKHKRFEFREAVEFLANRLGIVIPTNQKADPEQDSKQRFYKINQYARWFFAEGLKKNSKAQDYLKQRGLSAETIARFQLGYAEDSFESLTRFLQSKKIPLTDASAMGLIKPSPKHSGSYYDFYRDRVIFPIHDAMGRVIGFGGRTLKKESTEAKYINSAESLVYHKSNELYGFFENKAEILAKNAVLIVEGYTDVLACVQLGLAHVVAPLGTSLTVGQINRLKRYNLDVTLMFDGDAAGLKAAYKAVELCLSEQIHPRVAILPEGQDPGDFLQKAPQDLQNILKDVPFAMDWLILEAFKNAGSTASSQSQAMKNLEVWFAKLPPQMPVTPYRQKVSQYFGIPIESVNKVIEKPLRFAMPLPPQKDRLTLEEILVLLYWRKPSGFGEQLMRDLCLGFTDSNLKDFVLAIADFAKKHETFMPASAISQWPDAQQKLYAKLVAQDEDYRDADPDECLQKYRLSFKKRRLKELTTQIAEAEMKNNTPLKMQLLAEKQKMMGQSR